MRFAPLVGLLCGCNQIFGLDKTVPLDALPDGPPPDAVWPFARLSYQVAKATNQSAPDPLLQYAVIPDPEVKVAALAAPLATTPYVAMDPGGVVQVSPDVIAAGAWRLEFTPPGGVPHEVQWRAPANSGDVVVPIFGRLERTPPPAGSGYRINSSYNFNPQTKIFTTGYWSNPTPAMFGTSIQLPMSAATPLSGSVGAPDAAGDVVAVIEYENSGACRRANKAATFTGMPLTAGTLTDVTPTLPSVLGGTTTVQYLEAAGALDLRFATALGSRRNPAQPPTEIVVYGRIPHNAMPAFTHSLNGVVAPLMIPLVECPMIRDGNGQTITSTFTDVPAIISFPGVVFGYAVYTRFLHGVQLASSISTMVTETTPGIYTTDFRVPIPTAPITIDSVDLTGISDDVPFSPTTTQVELEFTHEVPTNMVLDYFEVVLHKFDGNMLVPVRKFIGTDPDSKKITIDAALFVPGVEYIFEIQTYRGRPRAAANDFTKSEFPQANATVFTRSFRR